MSSVNKEFGEEMEAGVKRLVENNEFNKSTNHVTFKADAIEFPKGITPDSLNEHVNFVNNLSAQVEVATGQLARDRWNDNNELTTVDATLNFGGVTINSQHHLKQQVGDDHLYGQATTAVDYTHSAEAAEWLQTQRTASQEAATKLFG